MKKWTKEKLIELGFEETVFKDEECLMLPLNKGNDRFNHQLRWYPDETEIFYIDRFTTRGIETISETRLLENHNNLNKNAMEHYKKLMVAAEQ